MKDLEEVFKEKDAYVICSTLNQIVNYIPIKLMEKKFKDKSTKIFNITVKGKSEESSIFKRFDNGAWDKNLENILQEDGIEIGYRKDENNSYDKIEIKRNECNCIITELNKKILGKVEDGQAEINCNTGNCAEKKQQYKAIVWNITGGQRSTIFAIQKFIAHEKRYKDCIIYLEGNSNDIVCMKLNTKSKEFDYKLLEEKYYIDLNLNTVFKLAGFKVSNDEGNLINYLKLEEKYKINDRFKNEIEEYELCRRLYGIYKKDDNKYLDIFINLNKDSGIKRDKNRFANKSDVEKKKIKEKEAEEDNKVKINRFIENFKDKFNNKEYSRAKDILISMKGNNQEKFGYILEYMAIASILETIHKKLSKYIVGVYHSVKLDRVDNKLKCSNTTELCEFDIVLLTKSGQVVTFECKSGTMSSDVGKSRQYTAYAAGGVYGKPVLITPLLQEDRKILNDEKYKKHEEYKNTFKALHAAARANMEVWGLDEIGEKLYELYKEALGLEAKNE